MEKLRNQAYDLLRWSEKYTKTDMVYLTKGSFWLTIGQSISSLTSIATSIAFANLLPIEVYGEYRYLLSIMGILAIPTLLGINTSLQRAVARGYDSSIFPALKARLTWGVFGSVGGMIISLYYLWQGNYSLATSILAASFIIPIFYAFEVYGSFLLGKKLFRYSSFYQTTIVFLSTIFLIITLFLTDNITLIFLSYFLPCTLLRIIFYCQTTKKYVQKTAIDVETISYGKKLSLLNIIDTIAENLDKLLLWHFIGPAHLAMYSFAIAPVNQIGTIKGILKAMVFPKIVRHEASYLKKSLYQKTFSLFFVMAAISSLYILLAPFLFSLVFPKYIAAVNYSRVFSLILLSYPFVIFMKTTFLAHAKIKEQYYLNLSYSIGKILLLIILVPLFGVWGVIASQLVITATNSILQVFLFRRLK